MSRSYQSLRRGALFALLVLTGGAAMACGEPEPTVQAGLTAEEFVEVVVALREAEREVASEEDATVLFEERKAEILSRYDTTDEELRAFLADHGRDLAALSETWDSIAERLKHEAPMDSTSPTRMLRRLEPEAAREQTLH